MCRLCSQVYTFLTWWANTCKGLLFSQSDTWTAASNYVCKTRRLCLLTLFLSWVCSARERRNCGQVFLCHWGCCSQVGLHWSRCLAMDKAGQLVSGEWVHYFPLLRWNCPKALSTGASVKKPRQICLVLYWGLRNHSTKSKTKTGKTNKYCNGFQ